ncbi:TauD/TfdA dioxygenase family protein [Streptomyces sp. NPDC004327]|uniref:TauD/TfdA dioxygenase family protein n=1 Tax=Streptomyces sp. NPDC004327 TaxID=3364699 RepID=UPI0036BFE9C3
MPLAHPDVQHREWRPDDVPDRGTNQRRCDGHTDIARDVPQPDAGSAAPRAAATGHGVAPGASGRFESVASALLLTWGNALRAAGIAATYRHWTARLVARSYALRRRAATLRRSEKPSNSLARQLPFACGRVEGLPQADGQTLLAELLAHATGADYLYTHRWRQGDLVVWDNLTVLHRLSVRQLTPPSAAGARRRPPSGTPLPYPRRGNRSRSTLLRIKPPLRWTNEYPSAHERAGIEPRPDRPDRARDAGRLPRLRRRLLHRRTDSATASPSKPTSPPPPTPRCT